MVAEMASCGAASHLENGDGDVPALENKDNLSESDSSSSDNPGTSTEDSAEEDEEEEEEEGFGCEDVNGEETENQQANAEESGSTGVLHTEALNGKEASYKLYCEKCKAIQKTHGSELVTPRRMSRGRLQVQLEADVSCECSVTGLVFEATERVLVQYSILSWSKFAGFLENSWKFAGPIFNVETVNKSASVLKSIQFPHCVCLAHPENEMTFGVLHIKGKRPCIEPTVDHSGSHVKWNVTSLSPVGPIIRTTQPVDRHGVVLVYKQLGSSPHNYSFHIYLAANSTSDIKDISKQVQACKNRYIKIDKPPTCKLDEGTYRLLSEPEGEIKPQELNFTVAVTKMKGYFEAFFEQPPPFKLELIEANTQELVWSATIREGDCVEDTKKKPRKRTYSDRKRSSSPSEEEGYLKRPRWSNESDGVKQYQSLSEKQLLLVANQLGKEWKQVAILLDWTSKELDDIQAAEKDVGMQKLKMLVGWKSKRKPGEATAYNLWNSIKDLVLPNELYQKLREMDSRIE
ncbi:NACHT, LRR and PYD domains-containing protein 1 [Oryzias melastigma]|uniref:NACHT, LRR and PYD domains-containing protein 1 n=1 Tax=Oryzias melastigma TaxID=30732 RepID=A0A834C5J7_ORYME|nr:NACHT, LRR and PYD domains-containing protein 1 [Oryzias melastigma]